MSDDGLAQALARGVPAGVADRAVIATRLDALERLVLQALPLLDASPGSRVLDLGSGGGFPGLPLAIARPDLQFTLLDGSERKVRFLRQAVIELRLANVTAVCARAEQLADAGTPGWDTIVARAVGEADRVIAWAAPLARVGGRLLLFADVTGVPCGRLLARQAYSLPGVEGERVLSVVQFDAPASA